MVDRNIISPTAGRMRPNTSASGIFSTKRRSAVSVSMLTRMLVPKPKNAFQSPVVHNIGRYVEVEVAICGLPSIKGTGLPAKGADVYGIRLPGIRTQGHPPPCGEVRSGRRHAWRVAAAQPPFSDLTQLFS